MAKAAGARLEPITELALPSPGVLTAPVGASASLLHAEINLWRLLLLGRHVEHRQFLGARVEDRPPDPTRKRRDLRVESANRFDVVAPGDGDPVFSALELTLERKEVLA